MQKISTKCMKIKPKNTAKTYCIMPKEVLFQGYKHSSAWNSKDVVHHSNVNDPGHINISIMQKYHLAMFNLSSAHCYSCLLLCSKL